MNQGLLKEFRDFLVQGNIVELAIAFIMAAAFAAVVSSLVTDVIMPFIAAIFGEPGFESVGFNVGDGRIAIGVFINAVVNFVLVGAAVFFFIVKPVKMVRERRARGEEPMPDEAVSEEIVLLREIRDALRSGRV